MIYIFQAQKEELSMSLPKSSKHQEMKHQRLVIGTIAIGIENPKTNKLTIKESFSYTKDV